MNKLGKVCVIERHWLLDIKGYYMDEIGAIIIGIDWKEYWQLISGVKICIGYNLI